jgi:murein DD-endopeptidase MepM/ murein hydrolase activator NlpD
MITQEIKRGNLLRKIYRIGLLFLLFLVGCGQTKTTPLAHAMQATVGPALPLLASAAVQKTSLSGSTQVYFTPTPKREPLLPEQTSRPAFQACSPLEGHTWKDLSEIVTNPFDPPPPGKDSGHHGVDFAYYRRGDRLSIEGVPVQSVLAGVIAAVIHNRPPYGNMVIVETQAAAVPLSLAEYFGVSQHESLYLLYAHMKTDPLVKADQSVSCGERLGEVGNTPPGWSSAPHLHLEVRIGLSGAQFASMAYYDNSITPQEKTNYERWRTSGEFRMLDPLRLLEYTLSSERCPEC